MQQVKVAIHVILKPSGLLTMRCAVPLLRSANAAEIGKQDYHASPRAIPPRHQRNFRAELEDTAPADFLRDFTRDGKQEAG